jgi:hypothetical protein
MIRVWKCDYLKRAGQKVRENEAHRDKLLDKQQQQLKRNKRKKRR